MLPNFVNNLWKVFGSLALSTLIFWRVLSELASRVTGKTSLAPLYDIVYIEVGSKEMGLLEGEGGGVLLQ